MPRPQPLIQNSRAAVTAVAMLSIGLAAFGSNGFAQGRTSSPPATTQSKGAPPNATQLPPIIKPPPPQTIDERFADRNERALLAFQYSRCMMTTIVAGRTGKVGAIPPNDLAVCVQQKGEWRGVFGQFDESKTGFAVHLQYSMTGNGTIVKSPIDTANVAGAARALVRASSIPFPGNPSYEFLPVILSQKTFYEIWFLSAQTDPAHAVVGGDSLIQMNADGRKELGHSKATPPVRRIEIVPSVSYVLSSSETDIPTISELMVANAATEIVTQVTVRTINWDWVRNRSAPKWRRVARTP